MVQATLNTPGEARLINRNVLESGIEEGVKSGVFGLVELENEKPVCRYFKETPTVALCSGEIIIKESICKEQKKKEKGETPDYPQPGQQPGESSGIKEELDNDIEDNGDAPSKKIFETLDMKFMVPKGKMSHLMGTFGFLQTKFDRIYITVSADYGKISEQELEDRIHETFRQLGIDLEGE